ncbi:MAG: ATP-binding protein, partial [Polaromonas sp.]|nr:ATP-binding protein [Polaromonas sp.]
MTSKSAQSIRSSLAGLVAACLIPAVLLVAVLVYYDYQRERARLIQDSQETAQALMLAVDREFQGVERSLYALSTSPSLAQQDLRAFHAQATEVLASSDVNNFVLIDAGGQQRLNTARAFGQPLPKANNLAQLARVFSTGRTDVSNLFLSPVLDRLVIHVALAVRVGAAAGPTHSLVGELLPGYFQKMLQAQQFPPGRIVVIADAASKVVARTHEIERFIGKGLTPDLAQRLKEESNQGAFELVTLEGIPALVVYVRSARSGWTVAIGTPIDSLTADLRRSFWLLTGFSALLLAGSLGLAWALGGRIARAVRALGPAAEQLGHGQAVVVPALPIREADEVARAMTRASSVLAQTHEALERSNLDLQQFAYIASHDLKTPLRSIGGFVQILEKNYADNLDEKALMLIHRTAAAVKRLEQLTEDLLSYARVNSEVRPFASVHCTEVLDEVVHLLDAAIVGSGAKVSFGDLPEVTGDRTQLVQLFLNLIGNGIKYRADRAPVVHVSARRTGREWVFSVEDNGIGIAAKHHEKVFEVFKRLHTQNEYPGTGIGLAVCRRVVEG